MVTDRTTKARAAAMFAKVTERDSDQRAKVILVPGSECKIYQVILRRNGNLSTECNCQTSGGNVACKGNTAHTVCYHSMAALIIAANGNGSEVSFCDNQADADRLSHLGLTVTRITSWQGSGIIWIAVRKPAPIVAEVA